MSSLRGALALIVLSFLPGGQGFSAEEAKSSRQDSADAARIRQLIEQLGSKDFKEREKASRSLDEVGEAALEALRQAAATDEDAEIRRRATPLVDAIVTRHAEAAAFARKILAVAEALHRHHIRDLSQAEWSALALKALYQKLGARMPAPLYLRLERAKNLSEAELTALLIDGRIYLRRHRSLDEGKDVELALDRSLDEGKDVELALGEMLRRQDPHALFFQRGDFSLRHGELPLCPLGAELRADPTAQGVRVVTAVKDGPAYLAGVRADDLITQITLHEGPNGQPLRQALATSTRRLALLEVARILAIGKRGSKVELTIRRKGVARPLQFVVVREQFRAEPLLGWKRQADDSWDYWVDPRQKIGYVRLPVFVRETPRELERLLGHLNRQGLKGLVLDLRFCPGGSLAAVVSSAEPFIQKGLILGVVSREQQVDYSRKREAPPLRLPLVCLIGPDTTSTAEVLAACLQDHHRAVIVGERSHGKGSIQDVMEVEGIDGYGLLYTSAVFLRPSGKKLDRIRLPGGPADEWGVTPDQGFVVSLPASERDALRQYLREAAYLYPADHPLKNRPPFRDRQLELALDHLRRETGEP